MVERVQIIKGFQDVLPPESEKWARIESEAREVFRVYGFRELRLPVLEPTELFARGIGQGTDIVEKEMFTFPDRKGKSLSLRPEGTTGAVRAYLSSGLGKGEAVKWWYGGPMFRYERPQKGRYRQFYQIGAEAIGHPGPGTDAELLSMLDLFFTRLGSRDRMSLEINSLGCRECRPKYREALVAHLAGKKDSLCEDCKRRLDVNPLRVLDCKVEGCKEAVKDAPAAVDFLDEGCKAHFEGLKKDLTALKIDFTENRRIVRGLDYYTRTVFEFLASDGLGSQNAVCAGGRYDNLVEEFGGPATPAIGFAMGVERLSMLLPQPADQGPEFFIVAMGAEARDQGIRLLARLRKHGRSADIEADGAEKSMKSQMKAAGRAGARYVVIIGESELGIGFPSIKDLATGEQCVDYRVYKEFFKDAVKNLDFGLFKIR